MNSYISIPLVKEQQIVYKKIPIPKNSIEFQQIMKNIDLDVLINQLDNTSIDSKNVK